MPDNIFNVTEIRIILDQVRHALDGLITDQELCDKLEKVSPKDKISREKDLKILKMFEIKRLCKSRMQRRLTAKEFITFLAAELFSNINDDFADKIAQQLYHTEPDSGEDI